MVFTGPPLVAGDVAQFDDPRFRKADAQVRTEGLEVIDARGKRRRQRLRVKGREMIPFQISIVRDLPVSAEDLARAVIMPGLELEVLEILEHATQVSLEVDRQSGSQDDEDHPGPLLTGQGSQAPALT